MNDEHQECHERLSGCPLGSTELNVLELETKLQSRYSDFSASSALKETSIQLGMSLSSFFYPDPDPRPILKIG